MTVQVVKFGRQRFVLLKEKDYRELKAKAQVQRSGVKANGSTTGRRLTAQDRGDIAEAMRRLGDPKEKPIPYEKVRKDLGLA